MVDYLPAGNISIGNHLTDDEPNRAWPLISIRRSEERRGEKAKR